MSWELWKHRRGSLLSILRKGFSFNVTRGSLLADIRKMRVPVFSYVQRDWPKKAICKWPLTANDHFD